MNAATITFEIDGQTVDALDARWYKVAPCGCVSGASVVALADPRYKFEPRITEESGWLSFYEDRPVARKRDEAAGFTVRLGRREEVDSLATDCPHTPKWGRKPAPVVDGYAWATESKWSYGDERRHLVPIALVTTGDEGPDMWGRKAALCGFWRYWWHRGGRTDRQPTCLKCERAAIKAVAR